MTPAARAMLLLPLLAAFAAAAPANAATGNLPANLADCLRANGAGAAAMPGCEDFFAVLHSAPPLAGRQPVMTAPAPVATPLARPAGNRPQQERRAALPAAIAALPIERPQPPCTRGPAFFLRGREPLEREGTLHYAAEAANRDARIAFSVPPLCRIESPFGGEVVFAGSFAGYGGTIILLDKAGNHIVMAGFDDLGVSRGETIARGAALGRVAARRPEALKDMFGKAAGALLYLEVRSRKGKSDPAEWLAANF
ncbi:peptidoglycan DD-metalloendopeptidase family protein [Parvibaculum sp.]|uniref:peptidoglycan DD-metalloendopeptidase family protein n=1 Tax=Parvibaculum sp. TaxID=2024848 RepID=UPI0034901135